MDPNNLNSPEYVRTRLRKTLRVDVPVNVIQDAFDNNKYFVFTAPEGHTLWTSKKNAYQIASTIDEVRSMTAGYNWDTGRVITAAVLQGRYRMYR